ncbi:AmmeMemoRadiSam system protein B [Pullulanibacillus sp. KACC 23026]|uniref:AmmeMemoRadiSam system protein B n=1 Tax=Pullulanibacillus sp. KACC 23026 TaxID=3028315 RepID=UPI0023B0306A|nr:AmmeMemoRadiSam system protein B [Pullulanibacillus sp. KACC 23026]WEG11326.1 AmmeMemoRadiSam system protein B [Pullulanibacillus sp. KACC 23026]
MGQLVYACMTPHGDEIIPELAGQFEERMARTRTAMIELGSRVNRSQPDVLLVITPHGTRIDGQFSISGSEAMEGVSAINGLTYKMKKEVDRSLAQQIKEAAETEKLPVGLLNYGTSEGPLSILQLDWGAIVPLRFMPNVPVVVLTPSRLIGYEEHLAMGKAIRRAIDSSGKRVALIASCDWSHTHDATGPYGFHEEAKRVDQKIVEWVKQGDLEALTTISVKEIEEAKPDGIWQSLILAGTLPKEGRKAEVLCYEAPTYFGLLTAEFYNLES